MSTRAGTSNLSDSGQAITIPVNESLTSVDQSRRAFEADTVRRVSFQDTSVSSQHAYRGTEMIAPVLKRSPTPAPDEEDVKRAMRAHGDGREAGSTRASQVRRVSRNSELADQSQTDSLAITSAPATTWGATQGQTTQSREALQQQTREQMTMAPHTHTTKKHAAQTSSCCPGSCCGGE